MRVCSLFGVALLLACGEQARPAGTTLGSGATTAGLDPTEKAPLAVPQVAPAPAPEAKAQAPRIPSPTMSLPEGLVLHAPVEVEVPHDKALRVTHAAAGNSHVILYLQGMCSDVKSADVWFDIASERGTVIALRPDIPCMPERPGFKWPAEPGAIEGRIEAALRIVQELRGGLLDTSVLTLVGYSQGSGRAELIASRNPVRYPRVVLGGHPSPVYVPHFESVARVALVGGDQEKTEDMRASDQALQRAGVSSRFFLLPRAYHGTFGPEGRRVMDEVLDWLDD